MLQQFWLCFIPMLVAIDVLSVVPLFLSFTQKMDKAEKNRLITAAVFTSFVISFIFLVGGQWIFDFLGIKDDDFRIGGGIVLLVLSVKDLLFSDSDDTDRTPSANASVAIVPLGIPLIMGPTALTTIQMLVGQFGYYITLAALLVNLLIVWIVFRHADLVIRLIGQGGAKAFAKVAALFMAAIAIMMIRIGLTNIIASH